MRFGSKEEAKRFSYAPNKVGKKQKTRDFPSSDVCGVNKKEVKEEIGARQPNQDPPQI